MTDMLCSHEFTRPITSGCLEGLFSEYGTILSSKVAEENGKNKGFGFVRFDSEKPTTAALLESLVKGKTINRDSNNILCFETEKQALLSFKQDEDFCKWDGIVCDNIIGHVQELRLAADFGDTQIPRFISSLVSLRYLNLTSAGFAGNEPPTVRKPSGLRHLGLGYNLYVERLHWLSSLSSLEYRNMTYVNLTKASDHWWHAINKLLSLLELHLISCGLG